MNLFYPLVLFIHVLSAMALFIAIGFEGWTLARLRAAENIARLREPARTSRRLGAIYGPAFLGLVVSGIYLAWQMHLRAAWVPLALGGTLLTGAISVVTGTNMSRLRKGLAQSEPSFENLRALARSNTLLVAYGLRTGMAVGLVFLMTVTPAAIPSLAALVIASILGIFFGLGFRRASGSPSALENGESEATLRP